MAKEFTEQDLAWVEHQLHVLAEYGFNHLDVHLYSQEECKQDYWLSYGDFDSWESGLLGREADLHMNHHYQKD